MYSILSITFVMCPSLNSTEDTLSVIKSFCISELRTLSQANSINSQRTPIVIEKQKANTVIYKGDSLILTLLSFKILTKDKPTPAAKKPFNV